MSVIIWQYRGLGPADPRPQEDDETMRCTPSWVRRGLRLRLGASLPSALAHLGRVCTTIVQTDRVDGAGG